MFSSSLGCSGGSGSGSLTQLIGKGALDQYLTSGASMTYFKTRYQKHTAFAIEHLSQPFNTSVSFGAESQVVLNRQGDLISTMYVVVDLPAISACSADDPACGGLVPGSQFPAVNSCTPCAEADASAMAEYLDDGYTEAGSHEKEAMMKTARDRWLRDRYGGCKSLACCEDSLDCPEALCPELQGSYAYWANAVGILLIRAARLVIGGSTIDTLYSDFCYIYEELSGASGKRLQ